MAMIISEGFFLLLFWHSHKIDGLIVWSQTCHNEQSLEYLAFWLFPEASTDFCLKEIFVPDFWDKK